MPLDLQALKDKSTETYRDIATNFAKKVRTQEEIIALELLRHQYNWKIGERISLLEVKLEDLAEAEVSNDEILNMELYMSIDELLEITLCEMMNHTKLS